MRRPQMSRPLWRPSLLIFRSCGLDPESSIRTLEESFLDSVHHGVPPLRRCNLYVSLEG
jgi:hypothetical protein